MKSAIVMGFRAYLEDKVSRLQALCALNQSLFCKIELGEACVARFSDGLTSLGLGGRTIIAQKIAFYSGLLRQS